MHPCTTCGNDIPDTAAVCEFCGSHQEPVPGVASRRRRSPAQRVATINLEQGQPTVDEALKELDFRIAEHRARGTPLLRVIHGYGSTGIGGSIKQATTARLARLLRQKQIRGFVRGEDYARATQAGRELLDRHRDLEKRYAADRGNPGITFVRL